MPVCCGNPEELTLVDTGPFKAAGDLIAFRNLPPGWRRRYRESPRAWREGYPLNLQAQDPVRAVEPAQQHLPRHNCAAESTFPSVMTSSTKRRMIVALSCAIPFSSEFNARIVVIINANSPGSRSWPLTVLLWSVHALSRSWRPFKDNSRSTA